MSAGWILVQTSDGSASRVVDALTGLDGVESAERTMGAYDVVVRVVEPRESDESRDSRESRGSYDVAVAPAVQGTSRAKRVLSAALRVPGVTLAVCCHDGASPRTVDLTDPTAPGQDRVGELHSVC